MTDRDQPTRRSDLSSRALGFVTGDEYIQAAQQEAARWQEATDAAATVARETAIAADERRPYPQRRQARRSWRERLLRVGRAT